MQRSMDSLLCPLLTTSDCFVVFYSKKEIAAVCISKSTYFFCDFSWCNLVAFELKEYGFIVVTTQKCFNILKAQSVPCFIVNI